MSTALALPKYLTTAQAAEMLVVAPDKIGDWIKSGQLPAVNVAVHSGGKARWRIAAADLERFLASRRTGPTAPLPSPRRRKRSGSYTPKYFQ